MRAPLRRFLAKNPLCAPLSALVCSLAGSWFIAVAALAVAIPLFCGLRRIALCSLLSGVYGWEFQHFRNEENTRIQAVWLDPERAALEITGSVVRTLGSSVILEDSGTGRRIEVSGGSAFPEMHEGERWRVEGIPEKIRNSPFPGSFDKRSWLADMDCLCHLEAYRAEKADDGTPFSKFLAGSRYIRRRLASALGRGVDTNTPGYQTLVSLVLGEKSLSSPETIEVFRRCGCLHVFAVSGLHMGLAALLAALFFRVLRCSPRLSDALTLVLLALYLYITGFPVSAVRAFVMIAVLLGGRLLRRQSSPINVWCSAAFLILLVDPRQLTSASFQLSFVLYAVVVFGSLWTLRGAAWWAPDDYIPFRIRTRMEHIRSATDSWCRGLAVVSLLAWMCSLPLTACHFRTINLFGFAINILIAPLLPWIMGLGLSSLVLSWIPSMAIHLNKAAWLSASLLFRLAEYPASQPASYLPIETPPPADTVQIFVFPYGGHACLLGSPGLLIDCGTKSDARHRLLPALFAKNSHPAAFLATHAHNSQIGGRNLILARYPKIHRLAAPEAGSSPLNFDTNAGRFTLYPPRSLPGRIVADDASPVVLWERDGRRLLFAGEAPLPTLLQLPEEARRADVLVIGMHTWNNALDREWILSTGAAAVYLLPPSGGFSPSRRQNAAAAQAVELKPESFTTFRLSEQPKGKRIDLGESLP